MPKSDSMPALPVLIAWSTIIQADQYLTHFHNYMLSVPCFRETIRPMSHLRLYHVA